MAKKKVMLFIVEGPTDETSLSTVLNRIFSFKIDESKEAALKSAIENDPFLSYIVNAIKYAAGETV